MRTIKGIFVNILLAILAFASFDAYAQGQSDKVVLTGEAAVEITDFFEENLELEPGIEPSVGDSAELLVVSSFQALN